MCEPIITLNICDNSVKIAESAETVILKVYRGASLECSYELEPISGEIFITDTEILDFGNESATFKLNLKTATNQSVNFIYNDCTGASVESEYIRVRFIECGELNTELNETC